MPEATTFLSDWCRRGRHLAGVAAGEERGVAWALLYFFVLLCSYYILRPLRDEMGIAGGVENLQWLFTGTFVAMLACVPLFGWLTSRYPRRRFLPAVYLFFIANLLGFYLLFRSGISHAWVARGFFIWVSVFNLFVVAVFWSFMADIFRNQQARRLFGLIAAGGTIGALTGPALTALLAVPLGPVNLLPVSAALLSVAVLCIRRLARWQADVQPGDAPATDDRLPLGGGILAGLRQVATSPYLLGISLLMLLFTTLATFLYFQQAEIVRDSFADPARRTTVFALIDLAVNGLTLLTQLFLTGRLVRWLGLPATLALVPLLLAAGFLALAIAPVIAVLAVVQVVRRAGNYAIMRPAREMLYVVLGREAKYKAKSVIDTLVYRGGDAVSAWVYTAMRGLGLELAGIALLSVPLALGWAGLAWRLGVRQNELATQSEMTPNTGDPDPR